MRSHAGGNLTAFLMFAVLLTVPLLAVFGIPEFVPASNPLSEMDDVFDEINFRSGTSPEIDEADSFALSARPDIFASVRDASSNTRKDIYHRLPVIPNTFKTRFCSLKRQTIFLKNKQKAQTGSHRPMH